MHLNGGGAAVVFLRCSSEKISLTIEHVSRLRAKTKLQRFTSLGDKRKLTDGCTGRCFAHQEIQTKTDRSFLFTEPFSETIRVCERVL